MQRAADRGGVTEQNGQPVVSPVMLPDLGSGRPPTEARSLRSLAAVPMTVSVILGKASMTIAEFESLEPGDLIRLDRAPDATVDLFINGVHVAEGDVIVIDDHVAARIGHLHLGTIDE